MNLFLGHVIKMKDMEHSSSRVETDGTRIGSGGGVGGGGGGGTGSVVLAGVEVAEDIVVHVSIVNWKYRSRGDLDVCDLQMNMLFSRVIWEKVSCWMDACEVVFNQVKSKNLQAFLFFIFRLHALTSKRKVVQFHREILISEKFLKFTP